MYCDLFYNPIAILPTKCVGHFIYRARIFRKLGQVTPKLLKGFTVS